MRTVFITSLGTSNYSNIEYEFNGASFTTSFSQRAILELTTTKGAVDEVIVIATEKALNDNFYPEGKLLDVLKEAGVQTSVRSIPNGASDEELMQTFEVVLSTFAGGEQVILDVTHGFRSIPIQFVTSLAYAKALHNVVLQGIYYGNFEQRDRESNTAPIHDISYIYETIRWSFAVNNFLKYGKVLDMDDIVKDIKRRLHQRGIKENSLGRYVSNLKKFILAMEVNKGKYEKEKENIKSAHQRAVQSFPENFDTTYLRPIRPLLERIQEDLLRFEVSDDLRLGLSTTQWCLEKDRLQQAYTALEETITTFFCMVSGMNHNDATERMQCSSAIRGLFNEKYANAGNEEKKAQHHSLDVLIEKLRDKIPPEYKNLEKIASAVKNSRNSMNHFGYSTNEAPEYQGLKRNIEAKYLNEFKTIVDEYYAMKGIESEFQEAMTH